MLLVCRLITAGLLLILVAAQSHLFVHHILRTHQSQVLHYAQSCEKICKPHYQQT